jgi:PIN domain nuclease of toxin-antitoxin system
VRLLLDTNAMLWAVQDSPKLGVGARMQLKQADVTYVSAVSVWEVRIKASIGKLTVPGGFMAAVAASGFKELPINWEQADGIDEINLPHRDLFDRLLLVQASQEQLILVTADEALLKAYPEYCLDARI